MFQGETGVREIIIDRRFQGPSQSANGGYITGLLAELLDGPAEVTLKAPPPLEKPLQLVETGDGHALMDGETLVASVRSVPPMQIDLPECPDRQAAEAATARYPGHRDSPIPHCFVCGSKRAEGDALRVFTGPLEGQDMAAAPWVPHANFADDTGKVARRYLLAALDCPGAWAWYGQTGGHMLLGRMHCETLGSVSPGENCTITAWPMGRDGRKVWAGTAVHDADGKVVAFGYATWITVAEVS